ncbi:DUF6153 family protein [Spinactinospora alkalitolerans]|uniref:DUF6153 family protein n=1 Tax=Spinactinospora alkalitolerans TaxID=687207 RepID=UPI0015C8777A
MPVRTGADERIGHLGPAWVRMLLLGALLFGVAAMHTLGHPQADGHGPAPAAAHADPVAAHADSGLPAMDPTSVCLAIGGMAIALLGLAAAVFTPWPGVLVPPPARIRWPLLRTAPPDPPSLAKLQVLRL